MAVSLIDAPIMITVTGNGVGILDHGTAKGVNEHPKLSHKLTLTVPPIRAKS